MKKQQVHEFPHARLTISEDDGGLVDLEIWPKQGQSAFVKLPTEIMAKVLLIMAHFCNDLTNEVPDNVVEFKPRPN